MLQHRANLQRLREFGVLFLSLNIQRHLSNQKIKEERLQATHINEYVLYNHRLENSLKIQPITKQKNQEQEILRWQKNLISRIHKSYYLQCSGFNKKNNEACKKKKKYSPHTGNLTKIVSVGSIDIGFTRNGL